MSLSALLDQSFAYERPALTPDPSGGSTRTYSQLITNLPCSVSPATAKVAADYARQDMLVNYHVYTTADLDTLLPGGPKLNDRLTSSSTHYLVKAVKKSANALITTEVLYQLDCERRIV
jgi:hypothetical protein